MNNSLYLKRYVETHPDNKMAWYLLGKEYEQAGEQGKANYCYNKAEGSMKPSSLARFRPIYGKITNSAYWRWRRTRTAGEKNPAFACALVLLPPFLPPAQAPGSVPGIMHPMGSRRMNRYPPRSLTTRSGIRVKNRCTSPLLPAREGFRRHTVLIAPASSGIAELDGCTGDEAFGQVAVMEQGHGAFIRIASGCKGRHCDPAI